MADIKEAIDRIEENRAMGLDSLLSKVNGTTGRIVNKALVGDEISVEEGEALFAIDDLDEISALAIAARLHPPCAVEPLTTR